MKHNPLFINFSNHPSGFWKKNRRQAALQIGKIIDLPFPNIPPTWSIEEVRKLIPVYLQKCEALATLHQGDIEAVHIMGEMTFTFAMVEALRNRNIPTLASTTERITSLDRYGNEVKTFHFVRFRAYSLT